MPVIVMTYNEEQQSERLERYRLILREELTKELHKFISGLRNKTYQCAVAFLHFPNINKNKIAQIAGASTTTAFVTYRGLVRHGWSPRPERDLDLQWLREVHPLRVDEEAHLEGMRPSGLVGSEWLTDATEWLEGYQRVTLEARKRLKKIWPDLVDERFRMVKQLEQSIRHMDIQELGRFLHYYMQPEIPQVFNFHAHIGHPFLPSMIYPNIIPRVAEALVTNGKFKKNWMLMEHLNDLDPDAQLRAIFPPSKYRQYTIYSDPQNQFELAGFAPDQVENKSYLVKKCSPSTSDKRTRLLNSLNIIKNRFPDGESGAQDVKRLLDNFLQVVEAGDKREIDLWRNAYCKAPLVDFVTFQELFPT